jgi:HD superfamily phosphohydrolase
MKLINDPVYGLIHVRTPLLFDIISHPLFQRLRRIKQTGLTHLVYPGAQHTRFHHALGSMHLMNTVIHELRMKGTAITFQEEEAALIAVLLHDIGHSPYSHALEGLIIDADHESIGQASMEHLIATLNSGIRMAWEMFTDQYARPFFHQLISGQLDLDRLDYLSRDSFYTGVAEGVVGHDRITRMLRVENDELVVEEKGLYSIEKFLVARRIMYWQVYLHKTVLAAELMAQMIIEHIKKLKPADRQDYLSPELKYFIDHPTSLEAFREHDHPCWQHFEQLDDVSVDYSFKRLQDHPDQALQFLAYHLMHRKLHQVTFLESPPSPELLQDIHRKCKARYNWSDAFITQMIWSGSEKNTVYQDEEDEIRILGKDGEIRPYSHYLQQPVSLAFQQKYYLCHPRLT